MTDEEREKVTKDLNVAFARLRQLEERFSIGWILKFIALAGGAVAVIVAAARAITQIVRTPYEIQALWHADSVRQQEQAKRNLEQDLRTDSILEEVAALRIQVQAGVAILCVKATKTERRLARVKCQPADLDP